MVRHTVRKCSAGLKIPRWQQRVGSIPTFGTNDLANFPPKSDNSFGRLLAERLSYTALIHHDYLPRDGSIVTGTGGFFTQGI